MIKFDEYVEINGKRYDFLQERRDGSVAVYKGDGEFMRLGLPSSINDQIRIHKDLEQKGFPIPKFLAEGNIREMRWYTEASIGDKQFTYILRESMEAHGKVTDDVFQDLYNIVRQVSEAQRRNDAKPESVRFRAMTFVDTLKMELPDYAEKIETLYQRAEETLMKIPWVDTHGDFNSHNIFKGGVIDLEETMPGPMCFDLVTIYEHNEWFPVVSEHKYFQNFVFSNSQKKMLRDLVNRELATASIPEEHFDEIHEAIRFMKGVWLSVKNINEEFRNWRHEKFIQEFI